MKKLSMMLVVSISLFMICGCATTLPIHKMAKEGNVSALIKLLDKGESPNTIDRNLSTPLFTACYYKQTRIIQTLLERGANPNAVNDKGYTPLHFATQKEDVSLLLEHGANPSAKDRTGMTPLHCAVFNGYGKDVVQFLIENGSDVNAENIQLLTPRDMACVLGKTDIVEILDKNGGKSNKYFAVDNTVSVIIKGVYDQKGNGFFLNERSDP